MGERERESERERERERQRDTCCRQKTRERQTGILKSQLDRVKKKKDRRTERTREREREKKGGRERERYLLSPKNSRENPYLSPQQSPEKIKQNHIKKNHIHELAVQFTTTKIDYSIYYYIRIRVCHPSDRLGKTHKTWDHYLFYYNIHRILNSLLCTHVISHMKARYSILYGIDHTH